MKLSNLKIAARLYLGFGAVVAVLVTLFVIAYANFARLGAANDMNIHTYQVLGAVDGALASLIDIETGERGFALTGQDASLEPYNVGKDAFRKYLGRRARSPPITLPSRRAWRSWARSSRSGSMT